LTTDVVDIGRKFVAGVVDTSGNLPPVVNLQLVVLTPVVHLELRISKVVNFQKIRNDVDEIIEGPGDDDSRKKP
jgi:hypothetical protein